jgi:hypothetical protein
MLIVEMLMAGMVVAAGPPQAVKPSLIAPQTKQQTLASRDPAEVARCNGGAVMHAIDKAPPPQARQLGDLPKANFELMVNRRIDGCVAPRIVGYSVGK